MITPTTLRASTKASKHLMEGLPITRAIVHNTACVKIKAAQLRNQVQFA